jgi:hypothetical protein
MERIPGEGQGDPGAGIDEDRLTLAHQGSS